MRHMTVDELRDRRADDPLAIVDIRPESAFADWHIPGAINVPVIDAMRAGDPAPLVARAGDLPRDVPLLMVCNRGISAVKAANVLEPMGFETIILDGGMRDYSLAWSVADVPTPGRPDVTVTQVRRNGKGCLSYLLGSADGRAIVVDPSVEVEVYTTLAQRAGLTIDVVLETHVHADHVSRALALCAATDATLRLPQNDRVTFDYAAVNDGDTVATGGAGTLALTAIATPGHTGESMSYRLDDEIVLTGDTLFVDAVGRPDLEKGDAGAEAGGRALYASLHDRLLALPDGIVVCPAHTEAGLPFDAPAVVARLGDVKTRVNLLDADEPTFIERIVAGIGPKPPSFQQIIGVNEGKADLGAMSPVDLEAGPNRCAVSG